VKAKKWAHPDQEILKGRKVPMTRGEKKVFAEHRVQKKCSVKVQESGGAKESNAKGKGS